MQKKLCFGFLIMVLLLSCSAKPKQELVAMEANDSIMSIPIDSSEIDYEDYYYREVYPKEDPCLNDRPQLSSGLSRYFVITLNQDMPLPSKVKKNAAIVIADSSQVRDAEKLFIDNICLHIFMEGYQYDIHFWTDLDKRVWKKPYNLEKSVFCFDDDAVRSQMKSYDQQMRLKPTHYIYNLKIKTYDDRDLVVEDFRKDGLLLFSFDRTGQRGLTHQNTDWFEIQLFDTSGNMSGVKNRIMKKYPEVMDVTEYEWVEEES